MLAVDGAVVSTLDVVDGTIEVAVAKLLASANRLLTAVVTEELNAV